MGDPVAKWEPLVLGAPFPCERLGPSVRTELDPGALPLAGDRPHRDGVKIDNDDAGARLTAERPAYRGAFWWDRGIPQAKTIVQWLTTSAPI